MAVTHRNALHVVAVFCPTTSSTSVAINSCNTPTLNVSSPSTKFYELRDNLGPGVALAATLVSPTGALPEPSLYPQASMAVETNWRR